MAAGLGAEVGEHVDRSLANCNSELACTASRILSRSKLRTCVRYASGSTRTKT